MYRRGLSFKLSFDAADLTEALYAESVLKGNTVVMENDAHEEGKVDLELFYKATMSQPGKNKVNPQIDPNGC
ncbi:MAG: hypothetical protein QM762_29945 [Chryseolinea sp.]